MAGVKEIQVRMKSIQETMKITNAMYLISSSKLRKAKQILTETTPYYYGVQSTIGRILRHVPDVGHLYFDKRESISAEQRRTGYIVVTADKGLAGGYNHDIFKEMEARLALPGQKKLYVLGVLGRQYFAKRAVDMDGSFRYTVQNPTIHRARLIASEVLKEFRQKRLDEVFIVFTEMENAVQAQVRCMQLLPLERQHFEIAGNQQQELQKLLANVPRENIALEPSGEELIERIVPNYLIGLIYSCLVESYACEQNARMLAMQASTDNASAMLKQLSLAYNRARQAGITQEITEVAAGAKAQKGSEENE